MIQGGSRDPGGWVRRKISSQSGQKGGTWIRGFFQCLTTPGLSLHSVSQGTGRALGHHVCQLIGNHLSTPKQLLAVAGSPFHLWGGGTPSLQAECQQPQSSSLRSLPLAEIAFPHGQSQGPPPPESPLDRPRLDWDPLLCQAHSQFYKAVPAIRLNEPILLSSCPAEAQCCAWRVVDVPHIGMGWIRPCQQPILWASAAPCRLSPDSLSRLM